MSNSEQSPKPKLSLKNKAKRVGALAGVFVVGAGAGVAVESGQHGQDRPSKGEAVPTRVDMNEINSDKAVNVFDGGQAIVKKADGSEVTIVNPIIADGGGVAALKRPNSTRPGGEAPHPDNLSVFTQGEDGVESIDYYIVQYGETEEQYYGAMGQPIEIQAAQAARRSVPVEVEYTHGDSFDVKPASKSMVLDPTEPIGEAHVQPALNAPNPNPSQLDGSQRVSYNP